MKKKDKEKAERSQSRRKVVGGRPFTSSGSREAKTALAVLGPDRVEARNDFFELQVPPACMSAVFSADDCVLQLGCAS